MAKEKGDGVILTVDSVTIGQVTDLSGPSPTVDTVESTTHDSSLVNHSGVEGVIAREFLAGLFDGGELTISIAYDPTLASHIKLMDLVGDVDAHTCIIKWNATAAGDWQFEAHVTGFTPTAPLGDLRTADITLKVTGVMDSLP